MEFIETQDFEMSEINKLITDSNEHIATLEAMEWSIKAEGLTLEHVATLESIAPYHQVVGIDGFTGLSNRDYEVASLEAIDFLKGGIIAAAIAAIIAFIVKLFKGRRSNKNQSKETEANTKAAKESQKEYEDLREEIKTKPVNTEVDEIPQLAEKLYNYLIKIGVDEPTAKTWTANKAAVVEAFVYTKDVQEAVFNYAMKGTNYEIIMNSNYTSIQDELRTVTTSLVPEAMNRVEYLDQLTKYIEELARQGVMFVSEERLPPIPLYTTDVGSLRLYLGLEGLPSSLEVASAFGHHIRDLFQPVLTKGELMYMPETLQTRYTEALRVSVDNCIAYETVYTSKALRALETLKKNLDQIQKYTTPNKTAPEVMQRLPQAYALVNTELKATAQIAMALIHVIDRSNRLNEEMYKAAAKIRDAKAFLKTIREAYVNPNSKYYSQESVVVGANGVNYTGFSETEQPIIEDLYERLETVDDSINEIESSGVMDRSAAVKLQERIPDVVSRMASLESFTKIPTTVNYNVTLEGLKETAQQILRSIVAFISKAVKRFIKWIKEVFGGKAADMPELVQADYDRDVKKMQTGLDAIARLDVELRCDLKAHGVFRYAVDQYTSDPQRDTFDGFNGDVLAANMVTSMSTDRLSQLSYLTYESPSNTYRDFIALTQKEIQLRLEVFRDLMAALTRSIKTDSEIVSGYDMYDHTDEAAYLDKALEYLNLPKNSSSQVDVLSYQTFTKAIEQWVNINTHAVSSSTVVTSDFITQLKIGELDTVRDSAIAQRKAYDVLDAAMDDLYTAVYRARNPTDDQTRMLKLIQMDYMRFQWVCAYSESAYSTVSSAIDIPVIVLGNIVELLRQIALDSKGYGVEARAVVVAVIEDFLAVNKTLTINMENIFYDHQYDDTLGLESFAKTISDSAKSVWKAFKAMIKRVIDWITSLFKGKDKKEEVPKATMKQSEEAATKADDMFDSDIDDIVANAQPTKAARPDIPVPPKTKSYTMPDILELSGYYALNPDAAKEMNIGDDVSPRAIRTAIGRAAYISEFRKLNNICFLLLIRPDDVMAYFNEDDKYAGKALKALLHAVGEIKNYIRDKKEHPYRVQTSLEDIADIDDFTAYGYRTIQYGDHIKDRVAKTDMAEEQWHSDIPDRSQIGQLIDEAMTGCRTGYLEAIKDQLELAKQLDGFSEQDMFGPQKEAISEVKTYMLYSLKILRFDDGVLGELIRFSHRLLQLDIDTITAIRDIYIRVTPTQSDPKPYETKITELNKYIKQLKSNLDKVK